MSGIYHPHTIMKAKQYQEFEIVPQDEHTHLRVRGSTVQDLFRNTLAGMAAFLSPDAAKSPTQGRKITQEIMVRAVDISSLLVEFISRVLAEQEARGAVFTQSAFRTFGDNFLDADITGIRVEEPAAEIRAVSYADVDIKKNPDTGMFETTLVFET